MTLLGIISFVIHVPCFYHCFMCVGHVSY